MHRVGRREGRGVGMSHICEFMCLCMSIHVRTYVRTMYMYVCIHMHCLSLPSEDGFADSVPTCHPTEWIKAPPTHCCMCCSLIPRPWCGGGGTRLHVLLPPHPPNCLSLHSCLGSAATRASTMCISTCSGAAALGGEGAGGRPPLQYFFQWGNTPPPPKKKTQQHNPICSKRREMIFPC